MFNNRSTDEGKKVQQVQQFLAHVASIGERNGGKPFTHNMHRDIKVNMWFIESELAHVFLYSSTLAYPPHPCIKYLFMFESTVSQQESERLREQQRAADATNLGESELAEMKKQLQMSYEHRMSEMQKMVNICNNKL